MDASFEQIADSWYMACAQAQLEIERLCRLIAQLPPVPDGC